MHIFSGLTLPNEDSVRDLCAAASVCPSWREAAKEPCLWRNLRVDTAPLNARLTGRRLRNLVSRSVNTLAELQLNGCPLVMEAALARAVQQQPCLVYVLVEQCALVTRPGLAHALCDAEDFQGVVAQLNDPRQSAADAQRCCVALFTLLHTEDEEEEEEEEEEAILAEAQTAGVLDALLRCAALHPTHAGVQAACCWALSQYVYVAEDTEVASYPPIFQAAVAALKVHPLDVEVQNAALAALCNVCDSGLEATPGVSALLGAIKPVLAALRDFPTNAEVRDGGYHSLAMICRMWVGNACFSGLERTPGVPALLDAIPLVVAVMRGFPTDLDVQHAGCDSLARMCNINASVAESVAAAGAMGLFIKALHLDFTNESIRLAAVDAIGALALSKTALPQATAGVDAVVHALNDDYESSQLAAAACKTLGTYLRCPATRELAVQAGAEAVVREALAEWFDDEDVQAAANEALLYLHLYF